MDLGLNGKVAIVTGGSMGIGKAKAMALARNASPTSPSSGVTNAVGPTWPRR